MAVAIRRYADADAEALLRLIRSEGDNWGDYHNAGGWEKYLAALADSIVHVLYDDGQLRGFVRARDDSGFGVYVYDLLVHREARGKEHGRALLRRVREESAGSAVYVMSDVDAYYERLGVPRAGSIYMLSGNGEDNRL